MVSAGVIGEGVPSTGRVALGASKTESEWVKGTMGSRGYTKTKVAMRVGPTAEGVTEGAKL